ncbi:MAG: hypothetical protein COB23_05690 [Methylophaga sp.]|nr:MAG: hypothetical protein COB23_05690 [Methylophaga sp.]
MNDAVDDVIVADSSPTIGDRLRLAREAKKLTIAEVAAQLRLPQKTIIHLEEQQWERLHGRIYARGYFSGYVKFLGLPFEEMLAIFNLEYKSSKADTVYQQNNKKPISSFSSLLLLSIIFGACWFSYQYWLTSRVVEIEVSPETPVLQHSPEQQDFDAFSDSVVEPLLPEESQQAQDDLYPVTEIIEQQQIDAEQSVGSIIEQKIIAVVPEIDIEQQEIDNATEQVAVSTIDSEIETIESNQQATLELVFSQDCWVEVSDAQSNILLNKTMQATEMIVLSGIAPLSVLLGNASAVLVKFNDLAFDIAPFIQGDVARFSVGVEL